MLELLVTDRTFRGFPLELLTALCLTGVCVGCQMSATGHNVEGVRYFQQGQHQAAVQQFQQALAANPNNADSYYNLAASLHESARTSGDQAMFQQAEGLYHQCLDVEPDHIDCHRALAVLLVDSGRPEKAFTLLERWAQRSPKAADARIELARLYEEFGDSNAARLQLTEALDAEATNSRAWAALGRLREQEGQYAQALANYQHAYNLNTFQPGVAQRITELQSRVAQNSTSPALPPPGPRTVSNPSKWVPR